MHIVYSTKHALHQPELEFIDGEMKHYHETADRAQLILDAVVVARIGPVVPPKDFGIEPIIAVHTADYVAYLRDAYRNWIDTGGVPAGVYPDSFPVRRMNGRPTRPSALAGYYSFDLTAVIVDGTWQAAYDAAQCALTAAELIRAGEKSAFALCRPPGHHAHADLCGGYCFLNNAAIAAHWLTGTKSDLNSTVTVAILDIDFHHGNGTQDIFYERSDVLYISLHGDPDRQFPYYLGRADDIGSGKGIGYTVNYPLKVGINDAEYIDVLSQAIRLINGFQPTYLVISLGVDTYSQDPLGDFCLTEGVFRQIGVCLAQLEIPTVFIMEGGYAVGQLGTNVASVLKGFTEQTVVRDN